MRLWIDLGEKRFDRVVATSLPAELDSHERPDAQRTLDFYQALAEFQSPSGSLDRAETLLEGLVAGRSDVSAYAVDLHEGLNSGLLFPDWVIGLVWRAMQALRCGAFYGAPNSALRELVELSIDRPAVWMAVEWQLQNNSEHLADLLHGDVQAPLPRSVVVRRRCRRVGAEDDDPRARGMPP